MPLRVLRYAVGSALAILATAACTSTPSGDAGSATATHAATVAASAAPVPTGGPGGPGGTAYPTGSVPPSATGTPSATGAPGSAGGAGEACVAGVYAAMTPAQRLGQLFMAGIQPGQAPGGLDATIKGSQLGSVIYLGGWTGAATVKATSDHVQRVATGPVDLFVAADQEGGAVQQLKGTGFTALPAAREQGRRSRSELVALGSTLARELLAAGVNVDLAPVADTVPQSMLDTNGPIGKYRREYGTDPAAVSAAVPAIITGLQDGGVVATVKHFPGLGRVTGNTDVTATGITDAVTSADDPFLDPFRAGIASRVGMVMVSSARYPTLDEANPAMFSRAVITDLLRGTLGFKGVVITDDVGAARAVAAVPAPDRAVRFLAAGGDIVLTANAGQIPGMLAAVKARAAADPAFAAGVETSVQRVLALKGRFGLVHCG